MSLPGLPMNKAGHCDPNEQKGQRTANWKITPELPLSLAVVFVVYLHLRQRCCGSFTLGSRGFNTQLQNRIPGIATPGPNLVHAVVDMSSPHSRVSGSCHNAWLGGPFAKSSTTRS
eukprot:2006300-Amphidinium_carterae.1